MLGNRVLFANTQGIQRTKRREAGLGASANESALCLTDDDWRVCAVGALTAIACSTGHWPEEGADTETRTGGLVMQSGSWHAYTSHSEWRYYAVLKRVGVHIRQKGQPRRCSFKGAEELGVAQLERTTLRFCCIIALSGTIPVRKTYCLVACRVFIEIFYGFFSH